MKLRERKILLYLLQKEMVTIKEITNIVGASEKTIRMDLKKKNINQILDEKNLKLIKKRGHGIKIVGKKNDKLLLIKELNQDQEELNYVLYNQKEQYILLLLLFSEKPISITKLEHNLYLTKGIIYNTLKQVAKICEENNLELIKSSKGYLIVGNEKKYRDLIFKNIIDLYTTAEIFRSIYVIDILKKFGYDQLDLMIIYNQGNKLIELFEQIFQIKLFGDSLEYFKLKIFISFFRNFKHKYIELTCEQKKLIKQLTNEQIILKMEKAYSKVTNIFPKESEILNYISQLSTSQTYYVNVKKFVLPTAKNEINIINKIISKNLNEQLGITLTTNNLHYLEKVFIQNYNAILFDEIRLNLIEFDLKVNQKYFGEIREIIKLAIKQVQPALLDMDKTIDLITKYIIVHHEPKLKVTILLKGTYEEIKLISAIMLKELQAVDIIDIFPVTMDCFIKSETELIITNTQINTEDNNLIFFNSPINNETIYNINRQIDNFKLKNDKLFNYRNQR